MIRKLYRLAVLAAIIMAASVSDAGDDVLYWMIDGNATITTDAESGTITSIDSFFNNIGNYFPDLSTGEGSAFAARVRVTGGNIQEGQDVFLDLYIPDYGLDVGGGAYGVEFSDDVGGYWGVGVPTGNQSPSGDYSAGSPEYSFIVELGNIDSSDNWTTLAQSAATAYSQLGDYIQQSFDINPSSMAVWTPTDFTLAPEPSSGLLTVIGLALLALRRKKFLQGA